MAESNRGSFGSKIGMILATAGGAVGLGNVWRFPYMAGQEGGAAFILVYIGCVLLWASLVWFRSLSSVVMVLPIRLVPIPSSPMERLGSGWATWRCSRVFLITGYYAVVSGWCLQYVYASIMGELHGDPTFVARLLQGVFCRSDTSGDVDGGNLPDLSLCDYPWCTRRNREGIQGDDAASVHPASHYRGVFLSVAECRKGYRVPAEA